MTRYFRSICCGSFLLVLIGCAPAPKFEKDVLYLNSIRMTEIKQKLNSKPDFRELKDQRVNVCFASEGAKTPACIDNVKSGQLLKIRSNARTFTLRSIEFFGDRNLSYAFKADAAPQIKIASNPNIIHTGIIMASLDISKDSEHPELVLYSNCNPKDLQTIQKKFPNLTVESHCFDFGATIGSGSAHPITLMTVMPAVSAGK